MGKSLKNALLKAGFTESKSTQPPVKSLPRTKETKPTEKISDRKTLPKITDKPRFARKEPPKEMHSHQMEQNFCEVCNLVQPDVEFYQHQNPTINANWICTRCADQLLIPDRTRKTRQSDFSRKGIFHREFR